MLYNTTTKLVTLTGATASAADSGQPRRFLLVGELRVNCNAGFVWGLCGTAYSLEFQSDPNMPLAALTLTGVVTVEAGTTLDVGICINSLWSGSGAVVPGTGLTVLML